MSDWNFQLEFKVQDLWIGAYWCHTGNCFDLWVCLVPCFPLHFTCWGEQWGMCSIDPDDKQGEE